MHIKRNPHLVKVYINKVMETFIETIPFSLRNIKMKIYKRIYILHSLSGIVNLKPQQDFYIRLTIPLKP